MNKEAFDAFPFVRYAAKNLCQDEAMANSFSFLQLMKSRRSVRSFSAKKVPLEVIENIIDTACTAPSGANKQPWTFCIVSDQLLKEKIKEAAEKEEYTNYHGRMSEEWKDDLKPFATDWDKSFLTTVPYLIVVFKQSYELKEGEKHTNYYVSESVGIACGMLLAAIENAGLAALTHTPSPMNFLREILGRPENEKAFLLIPVGYPAPNCMVPAIKKKKREEVAHYYL